MHSSKEKKNKQTYNEFCKMESTLLNFQFTLSGKLNGIAKAYLFNFWHNNTWGKYERKAQHSSNLRIPRQRRKAFSGLSWIGTQQVEKRNSSIWKSGAG